MEHGLPCSRVTALLDDQQCKLLAWITLPDLLPCKCSLTLPLPHEPKYDDQGTQHWRSISGDASCEKQFCTRSPMPPALQCWQQAGVHHEYIFRMIMYVFSLKQFLSPCRPDRLEQAGAAPIIPARAFPNSAIYHTAGRSDPAYVPATSRRWTPVECTAPGGSASCRMYCKCLLW